MSVFSLLTRFGDSPKISANSINIPSGNANSLFYDGINTVYFIAGLMAVIVIILAGFRYVTSAGDSGAVAKAKNQILWGIVGLIVVFLAFVITDFVIGRIQS